LQGNRTQALLDIFSPFSLLFENRFLFSFEIWRQPKPDTQTQEKVPRPNAAALT